MVTTEDRRLNALGGNIAEDMIAFGEELSSRRYDGLLSSFEVYLRTCAQLGY